MPTLEKLHQEYKGKGLVVLGINDEDPELPLGTYKKIGMTWPTVSDPERAVRAHYGGSGIPFSVIIDRQGKIAAQALGTRPHGEFLRLLRRAGL